MHNRLIGLTLGIDTDPAGWTTVVLTGHHRSGQAVVLGSLRTNATARPSVLAEVVGSTLIEEAFWSGLRPVEN